MKCFHCNKKIDESELSEVTAPDGDVFHIHCLEKYEKEREIFFNEIVHDDKKFADWMGISVNFIKEA